MSTITDLRAERERYWSQSRIGLFLLCSLKYAFAYVYKVEKEFMAPALPFGSAVHRSLEMMALSRKENHTMPRSDCEDLFAEVWQRQMREEQNVRFSEGEDAETYLKQGINVVGVFRDNDDESEEVLAVCQAMAVPLVDRDGRALPDPLIGELDVLVRTADGRKVICDWKTAGQRWPVPKNGSKGKADLEIQPTALLYAYRQTYGEIPGFTYRIVTKTKTPAYQDIQTARTQDDFDRLVEIVKVIDRSVKSEVFLPQQGFMCPSCQYQGACARWHRQAAKVNVRMAA